MKLATPLREPLDESLANSCTLCRYTPSLGLVRLTPLHSALTKSPRICTFHSYLKPRSFNRCAPLEPISFSFCRCEIRGEGDIRSSKTNVWPLYPVLTFLVVHHSHSLSPSLTSHKPPATAPITLLECVFTGGRFTNPFGMNVCVTTRGVGGAPAVAGTPPMLRCPAASGACCTLRKSR